MTDHMKLISRVIVLFLLTFSSLHLANAAEVDRPNIIWIIGEDMGPDLGCWGTNVHTPNIDRLAKEGMRFTQVFGTASVCMPNRTAMITGVTQTTLGSITMRPPKEHMRPLPQGVKPLPALMREHGYLTANIQKKAWGCNGKDDWNFRFNGKTWDSRRLSDLTAQQPFYAQFNFFMAHRPFKQDREFPVDPKTVALPPYYPDHQVMRQSWSDYLESIQHLDRGVGKVLAWLEREGLAENTIVFFLSDNGPPFLRGKYFVYDCSLNQPLIIHWPKKCKPPKSFEIGTTSDQLLAAIDVTAQTVACAGGEVPAWMHGRSFLGSDDRPRREVFSAADWYGEGKLKSRSIRTKEYRYIRNFNTDVSVHSASNIYRQAMHPLYHLVPALAARNQLSPLHSKLLFSSLEEEELYDVKADPHEMNNLAMAPDYLEVKRRLRSQLSDWIEESGDLGFHPLEAGHLDYFEKYAIENAKRYKKKIKALAELVQEQVANASNN